MLNLGDILYGPVAPKATYDLLNEYKLVTIRGNQDRQIIEAAQDGIFENPTMQFVLDELGEAPILWLKSLPFDCQLNDDVYMCHGSPTSDQEYLLENIDTGAPYPRTDSEITTSLNGQSANLILCGHTHIARTVKISSGQLIINPGSVGLQAYTDEEPVLHSMENYTPHASYAVIDGSNYEWDVQHIKVSYNYQKAADMAISNQRKDWGHFLTTGRRL